MRLKYRILKNRYKIRNELARKIMIQLSHQVKDQSWGELWNPLRVQLMQCHPIPFDEQFELAAETWGSINI